MYPEENSSDRVKQVQTEISQAVENFRGYNVVLKFATSPPASLLNVADRFSHKCSQEDSQIILNEQKNLETDVDLLNSFFMSQYYKWYRDLVKINEGEPIRNLKKMFTTDMLTFMMVCIHTWLYQSFGLMSCVIQSIEISHVLLQMRMELLRMKLWVLLRMRIEV